MDEVQREIWAAVRDMYDGFLAGDRARIDQYILPDATIWDSEAPALAHGLAELDAVRAARPAGGHAAVEAIDVYRPVIDVWGEVAVARHVFAVRYADPGRATDVVRNTGVWRRTGAGWRLTHNHEDQLPAATAAAYLADLLSSTKG